MFIIPFIRNTVKNNNMLINIIKILTIGGHYLWEEEQRLDIDNDILNPNSIYRIGKIHNIQELKSCYLCEVDINKTKLSDFYTWDELSITDTETFCWKSYIHISDNNENSWLEIPITENLSNYNVSKIIREILNVSK